MNSNDPSKRKAWRWPTPLRWSAIALLVIGGVAWLSYFFTQSEQPAAPIAVPLAQIVSAVTAGEVKILTVRGDMLIATLTDGRNLTTRKESHLSAVETLTLLGAPAEALTRLPLVVEEPSPDFNLTSAWCVLPLLGFMAFFFFRNFRQKTRPSNGPGLRR